MFRRCTLSESDLARLEANQLQRLLIVNIDTSRWNWRFLSRLPRLSALHISGSGVDIAALTQELRGRALDSLQLLDVELSGDASGLVELSCPALGIYDISLNDRDLRGIGRNRSLRRLALRETEVTDKIADELVRLPLEHLDLGETEITDATVQKLASIETLKSLDLTRTNVTDNGLLAIANLKGLRSLEVSLGSGVTAAGLQQLRTKMPACEIVWTDSTGLVKRLPALGR